MLYCAKCPHFSYSNQMPDIFLSHCTQDKDFVKTFDLALKERGFDTFRDDRCIPYGDSIPDSIFFNLERSKLFFCFVSEHFENSHWVKQELDTALMKHLPIYPILIADVLIPTCVAANRAAIFKDGVFLQEEFNDFIGSILNKKNNDTKKPHTRYIEIGNNYMRQGQYSDAIASFKKARAAGDRDQADLLIICCQLSGKNLFKLHHKSINSCKDTLKDNRFRNDTLATLLLAILYLEYYKAKAIIPAGISTDGLFERVSKFSQEERNSFEIKGLKITRNTSVLLGIKYER